MKGTTSTNIREFIHEYDQEVARHPPIIDLDAIAERVMGR